MNEEAIKVAYNLFVGDGYTKSIDEFKKLMLENPNGREVAYNLFVTDGYKKSIKDFSTLMGVTDPPVKKKEPTAQEKMSEAMAPKQGGLDFVSEDSSLDLSTQQGRDEAYKESQDFELQKDEELRTKLAEQTYTYAGRPGAKYKKQPDGSYLINLGDKTQNKYIPLDDPDGTRTAELNRNAISDITRFKKSEGPYGSWTKILSGQEIEDVELQADKEKKAVISYLDKIKEDQFEGAEEDRIYFDETLIDRLEKKEDLLTKDELARESFIKSDEIKNKLIKDKESKPITDINLSKRYDRVIAGLDTDTEEYKENQRIRSNVKKLNEFNDIKFKKDQSETEYVTQLSNFLKSLSGPESDIFTIEESSAGTDEVKITNKLTGESKRIDLDAGDKYSRFREKELASTFVEYGIKSYKEDKAVKDYYDAVKFGLLSDDITAFTEERVVGGSPQSSVLEFMYGSPDGGFEEKEKQLTKEAISNIPLDYNFDGLTPEAKEGIIEAREKMLSVIGEKDKIVKYDPRLLPAYNTKENIYLKNKQIVNKRKTINQLNEEANNIVGQINEVDASIALGRQPQGLQFETFLGPMSNLDKRNYLVKQLNTKVNALDEEQQSLQDIEVNLNQSAAVNFAIQEKRGSTLGAMAKSFLSGGAGFAGFVMGDTEKDIYGQTYEQRATEDLVPGIITDEYIASKDRGDLFKVTTGVLPTFGSMLTGSIILPGVGTVASKITQEGFKKTGAALRGLPSSAGIYGMLYSENKNLMSSPEFDDIPEWEKKTMSALYAGVSTLLEKFGLSRALSKTPLGKNLTAKIINKTFSEIPKGASAKVISNRIKQNARVTLNERLLSGSVAGLAESGTEFTQAVYDIGLKNAYNAIKEKDYFEVASTYNAISDVVWENWKLGLYGGFMMNTAGQATRAVAEGFNEKTRLNDVDFKVMYDFATKGDMYSTYEAQLNTQVALGKMTEKDAQAKLDGIGYAKGIFDQIPENLNTSDAKEAFNLIVEKRNLESKVEGKEPNLVVKEKERITEIDNELTELGKKEVVAEPTVAEPTVAEEVIAEEVVAEETVDEEIAEPTVAEEVVAEEDVAPRRKAETFSFDNLSEQPLNVLEEKLEESKIYIQNIEEGTVEYDAETKRIKALETEIETANQEQQELDDFRKMISEEFTDTTVTEKVTEEVTTEEQNDIDSLFKKGQNITLNRSKDGSKNTNPLRGNVVNIAKLAAKSISKVLPNVKIVLHETNDEYLKYAKLGDGRAEYNPNNTTIHVNLSKATKTTVPHEIFHAVLMDKIKSDPDIAIASEKMVSSVLKVLPKDSDISKRIEAFAKSYEGELQNEERLAELVGILSSEYRQLNRPSKNIIVDFLKSIAKKFGIKLGSDFGAKDSDVVDLLNVISRKTRTGEVIEESDIQTLEQEEQGSEGEVGTLKIPRKQIDIIDAPKVQNDQRTWVRELVQDVDVYTLDGRNFVTNMYDYTNAGLTELGNGYSINLLGGRNYVPIIMNKTGRKLGDVSNLAAFNTKSQAEGFIRNSIEGEADLFAPHSGTLNGSWQFQQHIFESLVDLVLDEKILSKKNLIDAFNSGLQSKDGKSALEKFNKKNNSRLKNLNSFKEDPKALVTLLDIENNYSPDLRKILNQKIASDKTFQKAIGVKNLTEFHNRITDPLNKGVVGGEIMSFIEFDPTTFEVSKTNPKDVDHHPSFGWVVKAKINKIMQPSKFFKSYDITDTYTKYNTDETVVSRKADENFAQSNVLSSAGAIPKVAKVARKQRQQKVMSVSSIISEGRRNNFKDETIKDYLIRDRGMTATEAKKALEVPVADIFENKTVPDSFKNIMGGLNIGGPLFNRVIEYGNKLERKNLKSKKYTKQEIVDKTIEFLQQQPEYISESDTYKVKGELRSRKGLSTTQAALLSDIQKFVGTKPTKNMDQKIKEARTIVRERKKGAKELNKVKAGLRNFIRKTLPPSLYTKKEVIDMVRSVTEANEKNIENVYEDVAKLVIRKNVESLSKNINNILGKKYTKVQSGRLKGKIISVAAKERIDYINSNIFKPTKKTITEQDVETIAKINEDLVNEFNTLNSEGQLSNEQVNRMVDIQVAIEYNNSQLMDDTDFSKIQSLDNIDTTLSQIISEGKTELKSEIERSRLKAKEDFEIAYEEITGNKIDLSSPDAIKELKLAKRGQENKELSKKVDAKTKQILKSIGVKVDDVLTSAEALDGLIDKISSMPGEMFGGNLQKLVTERIDESSIEFKKARMEYESMIKNKLIEIYGNKSWRKTAYKIRQNKKLKNTGIVIDKSLLQKAKDNYNDNKNGETKKALKDAVVENSLVLSQNQLYYLYNQYKDPSNHPSFESVDMFGLEQINSEFDSKEEIERKKEINKENAKRVMSEIENALEPEVKKWADFQVDELFPSKYSKYNDVYRKIYRTNMPQNENYAGKKYIDGVEQEPLDLISGVGKASNVVTAQSSKARMNTNKKIIAMDGDDALMTYLTDMEYFAAYAENISYINRIFSNQYISSSIENIYGKTAKELIDVSLKKIANRGARTSTTDKFVNSWNTAFIIARLALSPVIYIKQLTSTFTYMNDIGGLKWLEYASKNKAQQAKVWKEVRDNSIYMQDRKYDSIMKNIESYSEDAMKSFVPKPAKEWILKAMMYHIKVGDRTAIMLGGLPLYSYHKAQFKKKNPKATEQQAIDYAVKRFERATKRTQQSSDLQDKDVFQTGDAIMRGLNMFLTTQKQYLRKEIQSIRNLSKKISKLDKTAGKGTLMENVRTFIMYHIAMPVLFQYISSGLPGLLTDFDDEDEADLFRAGIVGNLNALFIIGEFINMGADLATGKPWAGTGTKSVGLLQTAQQITTKAKIAIQTEDPVKKAEKMKNFYLELFTIGGVPGPTLNKLYENYSTLGEGGDISKDILKILGYSNYVIEGGAKTSSSSPKAKELKQLRDKLLESTIYKSESEMKEDDIFLWDKTFGDLSPEYEKLEKLKEEASEERKKNKEEKDKKRKEELKKLKNK